MTVVGRTALFPNKIDQTTSGKAQLEYAHKEIHSGDAFYHFANVELDDAATLERCIVCPDTTKWGHFYFVCESQSQITVELYENVTINDLPYTVFNHNRNSAKVNSLTIWNLLSAVGATLIWKWVSGGPTATPRVGGTPGILRQEQELILKQNTNYLVRITSNTDDNTVSLFLTWYEHTNIEN